MDGSVQHAGTDWQDRWTLPGPLYGTLSYMPTSNPQGSTPTPAQRNRRQVVLIAVVLVVGVALGLLVARLVTGGGDGSATPPPSTTASDAPPLSFEAPGPPSDDVSTDPAAATTPELAVEGFLALEAAGDFTASYGYLSEKDVQTWPSAAEWELAHADFPRVTGFEIEDASSEDVTTRLALDSRLDQISGLVPARARGTWPTTPTDAGFRVVYSDVSLQPVYPSDESVPAAAAAYVDSAAACEEAPTYGGQLIGLPGYAQELCDADGAPELGATGVLTDSPDSVSLLNAFGPEVYTWARTVEVRGPVAFRLVMAPIDDQWQVIGLIRP